MTRGTHRLCLALLLGGVVAVGTAQPQPAPPPREPATMAELLVGHWKLIKHLPELAPNTRIERSFSRNGRYVTESFRPTMPWRSAGTYRLAGTELVLTPDGAKELPQRGQFQIEFVNRERLVLVGQDDFSGIVATYDRIAETKH